MEDKISMEIAETHRKVMQLMKVFDKVCSENNIWYTLAAGSVLGAIRHGGFIPWDPDMDVCVRIGDMDRLRKALQSEITKEMKLYIWDKEEKYSAAFDRLCFSEVAHDILHIDIYPLIAAPDSEAGRRNFVRVCYYLYKFLHCKHKEIKYANPSNVNKLRFVKMIARLVPDSIIRKCYHYLEQKYDFEKANFIYTIAAGYGHKECLPKKLQLESKYVPFEDMKLPIPVRYDEYLTRIYGDYMTPKREGNKGIK
jgi:lipopolysaccharide cholinephosphotransferase